eukprot:TRINITY_DN10857_c0_g1_i1.p1 TRINITY_DN10857_c0_g1~~TRINITY_DN10857_c0_g1_i1.p1  ORF type:complete len:346 (-),score=91.54 TRINITY_DN10857_c0_g1_i1:108-1145(-)
MVHSHGYAVQDTKSPLAPFDFERREPGPSDVVIDISFCGICHSDLHQMRNDWGGAIFPMVPGHEIMGKVRTVGADVKKFKVGDLAAVGCLVGSCGSCDACKHDWEHDCSKQVWTYSHKDKRGDVTQGGYADSIVVEDHFVLRLPEKINVAAAAPLLCAGITTYSPIRRYKMGKGHKVGVVGLGGLGHMAIKFAKAFGAHVTLFTHSSAKSEDAKRLGVDEIVVTKDPANFKAVAASLDFILDTVSAAHEYQPYLAALRLEGSLILLGAPPAAPVSFFNLFGRKVLTSSNIGGIAETQEMLDYCAEHNVLCDVEVIPMAKVNEAMERLEKSDVKYRFVIDMATLKQ